MKIYIIEHTDGKWSNETNLKDALLAMAKCMETTGRFPWLKLNGKIINTRIKYEVVKHGSRQNND